MGTQNKTLEGHLNSFKDPKAQELAAAWIINKKELDKPLSTITTAFPTYSLHDASHSQTIIVTIERLLGNNIKKLSATDTFMLLMAAYTHDLGMYLSYKTIEDKWKTKDFAKKISELENHRDPQIAKAAKLLRETQEKINTTPSNSSDDTLLWALEVKNAVTLLTIELFRGEHAKRSEDYLNNDSEFAKLLTNINQYGGLRPTLAKIAHLHGEAFNKVFVYLAKEANGYTGAGDMCHPRFVACMIRLGDLLDFDNNRFNNFALAMVKEVPETSLVHYKKHLSTGGDTSLISPNEIRVSFDCLQDDVYREAAKWKKMVEQELYNMHAFWPEIVPEELSGNGKNGFRLPSAKQINIELKYQGNENPNPDLMHLRFDISSKKTFEMLKGGAIYKNPGRVFLREIVQNALDATKLQIWQDLKGVDYLSYKLENPDREIKTICDIKFSDDIPAEVYDKYPINLSVELIKKKEEEKDEKKSKESVEGIRIICEDYGTGISEESLIRMTSKVGESRKADKDYEKIINEMPYFLQPTAAFGLGLQTIFYVANEFIVETCCPDRTSRRIIFRTSTNGSYCSVDKEEIDMHRGTKVIIEIDKDHIGNLFELDKIETQKLFDYPENIGYYIPTKIDSYVEKEFNQTENIPFYYMSDYSSYQSKRSKDYFQHVKIGNNDEKRWRVSYNDHSSFGILFRIEDNLVGSIMEIWYSNFMSGQSIGSPFQTSGSDGNFQHIMLRGVPLTKLNSSYSKHLDVKLNLFCRELDTFVSISRDELLPQGIEWCNKTLEGLMPIIIRFTHKAFKTYFGSDDFKKTDEIRKNHLQIQYSSLYMINWRMPKPIAMDYGPIKDLKTSDFHISNNKFEAIHVEDVLTTTDVLMVDTYSDKIKEANISIDSKIVIWDGFKDIIPSSFVCKKLTCMIDERYSKIWGYYLRKDSTSNPQTIELSDGDFRHYKIGSSSLIPGFRVRGHKEDRYETIVVNKEAPTLGYILPYHCNCWIYPLKTDFYSELELETALSREELKQILENEWIQKLVPDYIVKLIQKHSIRKNENLSKEEIYNTYIRFILDHEFGFEKPSKKKK